MFHWRDNLYFGRRADGSVRVLKFSVLPSHYQPRADDGHYERALLDVTIPAAEWASIVACVAASGDAVNYQRAVELCTLLDLLRNLKGASS